MGDRTRAVEERPVRLEVNGRAVARWTCTPEHAEALAVGRLVAEGALHSPGDIRALEVEDAPGGLVVRMTVADVVAAALERDRLAAPEVGGDAGPGHPLPTRPRAALPPLDAFPELFRELYASAERYQDTGGVHTAGLSDGARLLHVVEDVGRHNAVDKTIGLAFLAGDDLSRLGLVLTARVSGEIALKAARAGLAWAASRSVPTTLAVTVAETAGLPIVARAPTREPYVYAAPAAGPGAPATAGSGTPASSRAGSTSSAPAPPESTP